MLARPAVGDMPHAPIATGAVAVLTIDGVTVQVERYVVLDTTGGDALLVWGYVDPRSLPARVWRGAVGPLDLKEHAEACLRREGARFTFRAWGGRRLDGRQGRVHDVMTFLRTDERPDVFEVEGLPVRPTN
jgi:hypothetical protein